MIIATSAAKPFQYTGKGTIRRQACIAVYEEEIEAAYGAVARSSLASINPPTTWDLQGIKTFVNSVVVYVMKDASEKVKDDTELFQAGLDRCVFYACMGRDNLSCVTMPVSKQPGSEIPSSARFGSIIPMPSEACLRTSSLNTRQSPALPIPCRTPSLVSLKRQSTTLSRKGGRYSRFSTSIRETFRSASKGDPHLHH